MQEHLNKISDAKSVADEASSSVAEGNADAAAGKTEDGDEAAEAPPRKITSVEVVLARLLTDTLASLTRTFEKNALINGEVRLRAKRGRLG